MRLRIWRVLGTLAVVMALAVPALAQGRGGGPGETFAKGTATITGRVVSAATGRPLRRAQVRLVAPELGRAARTVTADPEGRFTAADLPAGRYSITASAAGHLAVQHGEERSGGGGTPYQLKDGETAEIGFSLPRAGRITGRVSDETGEPAGALTVHILERRFFQGRQRLVPLPVGAQPMPMLRTDDNGLYRMHGLPPGSYYVMATSRESWASEEDPKVSYAHATTYYPGVADEAMAQPIRVGPGQDVVGMDFNLVAVRAARVSGTAFRTNGQPAGRASVTIEQHVLGPRAFSVNILTQTTAAGDGTWAFERLPPGDYVVRLAIRETEGDPEGGGVPIAVREADIDGVMLAADPGAVISGVVITDDGAALPPSLTVTTNADEGFFAAVNVRPGAETGRIDGDGRFSRRGSSGPVRVHVSVLPPGWSIRNVEIDGEDFADRLLVLDRGQRLEGVRVVLTRRFPTLTGSLTDDRGTLAAGTVLLFPADESRWLQQGAMVTRPDQAGVYRFSNVRPGEYLVAAVAVLEPGQSGDPEFLASLRSDAAPVTLREGEHPTHNLRVAR
jgi:hypothetical protein